jgi:hypothetical protein
MRNTKAEMERMAGRERVSEEIKSEACKEKDMLCPS